MNKKIVYGLVIAVVIALIAYGVQVILSPNVQKEESVATLRIVASIYPLADVAKNIAGNRAVISTVTPAGTEPHDYEPTARDITEVYDADLFLFNGNGVDTWAEKIQGEMEGADKEVIRMADHVESLKNPEKEESSAYDPHFWLDPINVATEAKLITETLKRIDPAGSAYYNERNLQYQDRLTKLDQLYRDRLAHCEQREIITSHNAFNYLAKRYNLTTFFIAISPEEEPSPRDLAETAKIAKQKKISHIFFETLVSPKLSQTIASEVGVKTLELNPIEGFTDEQIASGRDYISQMESNLTNLTTALQCR